MSRPQAAPGAAASSVAASALTLATLLSPARAAASRKNGARSRGPKSAEGKQRSSRNALKHGLCARKHVVVEGERPDAFAAFEAALVDDLAPEGALQMLLAGRIARAAWRLERAERIEAELFAREMEGLFGTGDLGADLGLALIRDCNGARAFETLLRYRGAAQAEFSRSLRLLRELQREAEPGAGRRPAERAAPTVAPPAPPCAAPIEPEHRAIATARTDEPGVAAPATADLPVNSEHAAPLPCGHSPRAAEGPRSPQKSWRNGARNGSRQR